MTPCGLNVHYKKRIVAEVLKIGNYHLQYYEIKLSQRHAGHSLMETRLSVGQKKVSIPSS